MRELHRSRDWKDWTSQIQIWDWDDEWEWFDLSSETAMSSSVLGLLSSTETEIRVLSSQLFIAIGLKKNKLEKKKALLSYLYKKKVWKLTS